MKRFVLLLGLVFLTTTDASAFCQCNGCGVIAVHDAGLLLAASDGALSVCPQGSSPANSSELDTRLDGAQDAATARVFKVYAVFPSGCYYGLAGMAWGIHYPAAVHVVAHGNCGDFELPDDTWPLSDTGNSVSWNGYQSGSMVPAYWFAAYSDGGPCTFDLAGNPSQGGVMAGDWIPAILDNIQAFGRLGFDTEGVNPSLELVPKVCCRANGQCTLGTWAECPDTSWWDHWYPNLESCDPFPCRATEGACCFTDGHCEVGPSSACTGYYVGEGSVCDPSPCTNLGGQCCFTDGHCEVTVRSACVSPNVWSALMSCTVTACTPPTPVERVSWGRVKQRYSR